MSFEARLQGFLVRWSDVEGSIKEAEQLQGDVTIPAINELRYAGRHLLRALSLSKTNGAEADLDKAVAIADQYLTNADHDVIDATVVFIGRRIDELNLQFGKAAIVEAYPPYAQALEILDIARTRISSSRRNSKERLSIYAELKANVLPTLLESYKSVIDADVIMGARIAMMQKEVDRYREALVKTSFALFVVSILFAALLSGVAVHLLR